MRNDVLLIPEGSVSIFIELIFLIGSPLNVPCILASEAQRPPPDPIQNDRAFRGRNNTNVAHSYNFDRGPNLFARQLLESRLWQSILRLAGSIGIAIGRVGGEVQVSGKPETCRKRKQIIDLGNASGSGLCFCDNLLCPARRHTEVWGFVRVGLAEECSNACVLLSVAKW
jgi:hypothetical protein